MGEVLAIPKLLTREGFERPPGLPAVCTDEELLEACKAWMCGAQREQLAELLHVPPRTVKYWIESREFLTICREISPEVQAQVSGSLTRLRNQALTELADRLEHGDPMYNNRGREIGRRRLSGKTLVETFCRLSETQINLEKVIGGISDDSGRIDLETLKRGLAEWARQAQGKTFDSSGAPVDEGKP